MAMAMAVAAAQIESEKQVASDGKTMYDNDDMTGGEKTIADDHTGDGTIVSASGIGGVGSQDNSKYIIAPKIRPASPAASVSKHGLT